MAYSDQKIAETLVLLEANDGNVLKTAQEAGVSRACVRNWRDAKYPLDADRPDTVARTFQARKQALAEDLQDLASLFVGDMAEQSRRKKASMGQLATAMGISVDKMQLLRGEPTGINEQRGGGVTILQQFNNE